MSNSALSSTVYNQHYYGLYLDTSRLVLTCLMHTEWRNAFIRRYPSASKNIHLYLLAQPWLHIVSCHFIAILSLHTYGITNFFQEKFCLAKHDLLRHKHSHLFTKSLKACVVRRCFSTLCTILGNMFQDFRPHVSVWAQTFFCRVWFSDWTIT